MAGETNKRKRNNNANKRRKKSKPNNPPQRKKNWIESCSESINRIPVGSTAPICCVVSRIELEEVQLLPLGNCAAVEAGNGEANEALVTKVDAVEASTFGQEAPNKDDATQADDATEVTPSGHKSQDKVVAAAAHDTKDKPSKQIALLKTADASDAPFKICNTIQVNGEGKKIFIPVKRDASANGPTQVCCLLCLYPFHVIKTNIYLDPSNKIHSGNSNKNQKSLHQITTTTTFPTETTAMAYPTPIPNTWSPINSGHNVNDSLPNMTRVYRLNMVRCGIR